MIRRPKDLVVTQRQWKNLRNKESRSILEEIKYVVNGQFYSGSTQFSVPSALMATVCYRFYSKLKRIGKSCDKLEGEFS